MTKKTDRDHSFLRVRPADALVLLRIKLLPMEWCGYEDDWFLCLRNRTDGVRVGLYDGTSHH